MYDTVNHGPVSCSIPADTNIQYQTSQEMFVYLNTAAETLYEAPRGLSKRLKHLIISLIMIFEYKTLQRNFLFTLPAVLPSASASTLSFFPCLSNRILSLFPSASLSTAFSSWFCSSHHFVWTILISIFPVSHLFPSKANTQMCCFCGVAPSLSTWHLTLSECCLLSFIFCPLSFLTVHPT